MFCAEGGVDGSSSLTAQAGAGRAYSLLRRCSCTQPHRWVDAWGGWACWWVGGRVRAWGGWGIAKPTSTEWEWRCTERVPLL